MINPFAEQVFSKDEKQALYDEVSTIKNNVDLLKSGDLEALKNAFVGLNTLINSYLTAEEKDLAKIQDEINKTLILVKQSADFVLQSKIESEKNADTVKMNAAIVKTQIDESTNNLNEIKAQLAQTTSLANSLTDLKKKLSETVSEIEQIALKSEAAQLKLDNFQKAVEDVEDSKNKASATTKTIRDFLLEVKALHLKILGSEEKDEKTGEVIRTDGLVDVLNTAYNKLENDFKELQIQFIDMQKEKQKDYEQIKTSWEVEFTKLKTKIESLLPGALSAGLSQAYEEKKNSEIEEISSSSKVFYVAIIGLILISAMPAAVYIYLLYTGKKTFDEILLLAPNVLFFILPVYVPFIWVAYSADKKMKLSKRLAEEYAHKAALCKTFEGISKQVSNLQDNRQSTDLESKLLYNIIQVSAENPGKLISDYDKTDHPLYDALDKGVAYAKTLEKLSFIPGVDKLLASVQKRKQKRLTELAGDLASDDFNSDGGPLNGKSLDV